MARGDHWWNEPPLWAWLVIGVSVVAIAVMLPFALNRQPPDDDNSGTPATSTRSSCSSPAPSTAPSTAPTSTGSTGGAVSDELHVFVIGDSDARGTTIDSGWPGVLEQRIDGVDVDAALSGDVGYVSSNSPVAPALPALTGVTDLDGVDAVIVSGGRYDGSGIADQVGAAAADLFADIRRRAPDAAIVVIGPISPATPVPAALRNNRDVIEAAADDAGATFVDPLEDGWLQDAPDLIGVDGVHLSDAAETYLADRIEPVIREALGV